MRSSRRLCQELWPRLDQCDRSALQKMHGEKGQPLLATMQLAFKRNGTNEGGSGSGLAAVPVCRMHAQNSARLVVLPENDEEHIARILGPLARARVFRLGRVGTLALEETLVHGLVDALAGGCNGGRANWRGAFDGLRIYPHGSVFSTYCEVPAGGIELGVHAQHRLISFRGVEETGVIARLNDGAVFRVGDLDIVAVRKGLVGVEEDGDDDKRNECDAA